MVMQVPGVRDMPDSADMKSLSGICAGAHRFAELPDVRSRANVAGRGTCR